MTLILIRHAQKGLVPFEDPELSSQGFRQAQVLNSIVELKKLPEPSHLWGSKKIRTHQTLEVVAKTYSLNIEAKSELNFREDLENSFQFRDRIKNTIHSLTTVFQKSNSTIYLCTHYDWIEEAMSIFDCDKNLQTDEFSHWAPAQYLVLDYNSENQIWLYKKTGVVQNL